MSVRKIPVIIFFLFYTVSPLFAQPYIKGIIVEKNSKLPIAFASVTYQKQTVLRGVISDIHGRFEITDRDIKSLQVSCVGYQKKKVVIAPGMKLSDLVVELGTDTLSIGEITITPDMNPAIRIIKNVLRNKGKNDFENYGKYSYECYLKTNMNMKLSYNTTSTDSSALKKNREMNRHASFISESVIISSTVNKKTDNKIIAVKTSGFETPVLGQYFVTAFHNAISFYRNNISLFAISSSTDMTSTEYLSPVSDECLRSYNFLLEETYENPSDTLYLIEFHPKKGSNFNGLKGKLYISSKGWGIKSIITEPFEKGLIDFRFRQEYELVGDRWFPSGLDEEIGFVSMKINKKIQAVPVYLITSRISKVNLDPAFTIDSIHIDKVYIDEKSIAESESILDSSRPEPLSQTEKNTYQFLDSLGGKYKFDYWADLYPYLSAGKIPVSFIEINLEDLFISNEYEGSRIGLGLNTNDKFSKVISFGGFAGYGLQDREFKYGGDIRLKLDPESETELRFSYQNNLKEPGLDQRDEFSLLSYDTYLRDYLASRMDNFIEERAELNFRISRYLKIFTSLSLREIKPAYEYSYKGIPLTDFLADEFRISARFAYKEEIQMFGNQRVAFYEGNPVISVTYKKGLDLYTRDSYNYNRVEATIDFTAYKGRLGQTDFRIAGGYIDRPLPYSLLFTGEGSRGRYPVLINNTFQTMKPYEFLSDRYVNVFFSHNFGSLLLETPRFKPKIIIAHNTGWGLLRNAEDHGIDFKVKDKVYLESGLLLNNLIRFKLFNLYYIGFGGGAFYRYGYYRNDKFMDNLALKVSMTVALE